MAKLFFKLVNAWFAIIAFSTIFICCNSKPKSSPPPEPVVKETKTGLASYYGRAFDGQKTANGEIFHSNDLVAAHPTYPLGTIVRVTNLDSPSVVQVRITDRGPTPENVREGVIIDLSKGAAQKLKMVHDGRVRVKVEVLQWGK
jgi:rare lipoprotein A